MSSPPVFKIAPTTQQYDWGKTGSSSSVAHFALSAHLPGFSIDEKAPYAELWMGTHPKSPSTLLPSGTTLSAHLKKHPELMGSKVSEKFPDAKDGNLPFLFKVLSIEKALSIQSHPDKKTAELLFEKQPEVYKDPNHKPEMALALTPFQALCGFRPLDQIARFIRTTPELAALIPQTISSTFLSISFTSNAEAETKAALKNLFASLMTAEESLVKEQLGILVARYQSGEVKSGEEEVSALVLRLNSQFPGDIGVFCAFVLNYVHLKPGEAIFLGAGEPHAYIYGECIECMANSDNVIRAGLTPKLRDIPNLIAGLTYTPAEPSRHIVNPSSFPLSSASTSNSSILYDPPIPEFSVVQIILLPGGKEEHEGVKGPSVIIITAGQGRVEWDEEGIEVREGEVLFVGARMGVVFKNAGEREWVGYRAYVEA
ncbi:mannose-6-phosphate isomerase [Cyathus striatus]|nr:mannose-6-phosphate isomerase [Cyathus striatus]